MSRRELIDLGITLSPSTMTDSNATGTTTPVLETFNVNPHANNINPSTDSGSKIHMKATEPLPKVQQLEIAIDNVMNFRNHLKRQ